MVCTRLTHCEGEQLGRSLVGVFASRMVQFAPFLMNGLVSKVLTHDLSKIRPIVTRYKEVEMDK